MYRAAYFHTAKKHFAPVIRLETEAVVQLAGRMVAAVHGQAEAGGASRPRLGQRP